VPDGLVVSHMPYGPTAYFGLHNVVMRHDIPDRANVSEAFPHLVQHNLNTRIGKRVATILKHLFPVPKPDSRRVMSFVNQNDFIAFRHHTRVAPARPPPLSPAAGDSEGAGSSACSASAAAGWQLSRSRAKPGQRPTGGWGGCRYAKEKADVHLYEVGPRFDLKLYQIKLGTMDQTEVENEWVLRPYMNSARNRKALG